MTEPTEFDSLQEILDEGTGEPIQYDYELSPEAEVEYAARLADYADAQDEASSSLDSLPAG